MEDQPRLTTVHTKMHAIEYQELEKLFAAPDFFAMWTQAATALHQHFTLVINEVERACREPTSAIEDLYRMECLRPTLRKLLVTFNACTKQLLSLIVKRSPVLVHGFGGETSEYLFGWYASAMWQYIGFEPDPTWGQAILHLLPDHPVAQEPDGHWTGFEAMKEVRHFYQWRDYLGSFEPPGKRGPRQKTEKRQSRGAHPIDPALSTLAYEMSASGKDWTKIAAHFWPTERYHNKKERDRLYRKTRRYIERGKIVALHTKDDS